MRRVEGDCHDLYLGESHGFRGSSQLRPWGAGILNKPKNRSCHLPPTANFTFTPIFHQKFLEISLWFIMKPLLLAFIWSWVEFEKQEEIFEFGPRRYFSAASLALSSGSFAFCLSAHCVSAYCPVWYLLIIFSIGDLSNGISTQVMGGNQPVDC